MADDVDKLWAEADHRLQNNMPAEAICYLAEIVGAQPTDRRARLMLAVALGDAGNPAGAIRIMQVLADRLVHDGFLLPAIVVIRHGMHHAGTDARLLRTLQGLHVRGVRAKAGQLAVPPPLKAKREETQAQTAADLLKLPAQERLATIAELGATLPAAGPAAEPMPMPLFCELETEAFVETVKRLQYRRVLAGTALMTEGEPGDSLVILVSGQVAVSKAGTELAKLGGGSVLGEMALITKAPRSATATATEDVECFELGRDEVAELAKAQPTVLQELVAYCRRRLLLNLLRTSPLFKQFDEESRVKLLERFQTITLQEGEPAIVQGATSAGLFVIASGNVEVQVENDAHERVTVATLGPGEVFGEISLLRNQPTTAHVVASGTVGALVLPSAEFHQMLQQFPQARQYLEGLSDERIKASYDAVSQAGLIDPDDLVVL
jgi:CRP-like cAMP-binding protein